MFMKKNRSLNLKYAGSQIFYFAAFAAMMGYASVFLLDKGCSNSQIGIALSSFKYYRCFIATYACLFC